jgi:hypothetical protein
LVASADFAAGADEGIPVPCSVGAGEEDFDLAAWLLLAARGQAVGEETGGDDSAVVEDEQVAWVQEGWEIGEAAVCERIFGAIQDQHAAGAAFGGRLLGDEFFWQVEVEVGDAERLAFGRGLIGKVHKVFCPR